MGWHGNQRESDMFVKMMTYYYGSRAQRPTNMPVLSPTPTQQCFGPVTIEGVNVLSTQEATVAMTDVLGSRLFIHIVGMLLLVPVKFM